MARSARSQIAAVAVALAGGTAAFLLSANETQLSRGALWGLGAMLVGVVGALRAFGLFERADDTAVPLSATSWYPLAGESAWCAPRVAAPIALALVVTLGETLGARALPGALVAALALLVPAALRRPAWFAFVLVSLLYLPLLGTFGLWDPWETHYGEVAREILSRDDWISLWWAQDKWFWSKPIFIFWMEALLWSMSGIAFRPDSNFTEVEWVLRLPLYFLSVGALLAVYALVRRVFHARAALLAVIVLATTPYFGLLTRQAITDLPYVALMTIAVMLLLYAVQEDPEREAPRYRIGPVTVSARELVLGVFLLFTLPQVLYLASRNVTFVRGLFAWHRDEFLFGSAYNPDVPGNFGLRDERPWRQAFWLQPMAQALFWLVCVAGCTRILAREKRAQALALFGFYLACALAFMAKGIPGFALPGLVAFLVLASSGRWALLGDGRLRVAAGALLLVTVALPWFVAMFVRHGPGFTDRILIHDHINRLTSGVHGDKGSIAYFIGEFAYGIFPWVVFAPAALGAWLVLRGDRSSDGTPDGAPPERDRARREVMTVLGLWFAATFTLFSAMTTKFHHYVFPAVPPAAILIGLFLDRMLGNAPPPDAPARDLKRGRVMLALAWLAPVPLVLGVAGLWGDVRGVLPKGLGMAERATWAPSHPWNPAVCVALLMVGAACLGLATIVHRRAATQAPIEADPPGAGAFATAAAVLAGLTVAVFTGRDLSWTTAERPAGQERLVQLFVYNYDRPFPEHLDYRAIFTGFAIVTGVLAFLSAVRFARPVFVHAFVALAVWCSAWTLNVYMIDLTPHWSQRDLVQRYYRLRKSPDEALVAWQMNWKGENFYTGNRVAVFVDLDNKKVKDWMDARKGKRAFVLLEHKRLDRFRSLAGKRVVKALTTERDNNKFALVEVRL
jgi:4-amino-4-deoxy-L-arabinose transferase-like glycosyltransferase